MPTFAQAVRDAVAPLRTQIQFLVGLGRFSRANDDDPVQSGQAIYGIDGAAGDDVLRPQDYGFTSVPPDKAQALFIRAGGRMVVLRADAPKGRPKGLPGESIQYTQFGHRVYCKADGTLLLLDALGSKIETKPDGSIALTPFNGNVLVNGNLTATGNVSGAQVADAHGNMLAMRTVYNGHMHPENNGAGGVLTTNPPTVLMP